MFSPNWRKELQGTNVSVGVAVNAAVAGAGDAANEYKAAAA